MQERAMSHATTRLVSSLQDIQPLSNSPPPTYGQRTVSLRSQEHNNSPNRLQPLKRCASANQIPQMSSVGRLPHAPKNPGLGQNPVTLNARACDVNAATSHGRGRGGAEGTPRRACPLLRDDQHGGRNLPYYGPPSVLSNDGTPSDSRYGAPREVASSATPGRWDAPGRCAYAQEAGTGLEAAGVGEAEPSRGRPGDDLPDWPPDDVRHITDPHTS